MTRTQRMQRRSLSRGGERLHGGAEAQLPINLISALRAQYALLSIELAADSLQRFPAAAALLRDTSFGLIEHKFLSRALTSIARQVAWTTRAEFPRCRTKTNP